MTANGTPAMTAKVSQPRDHKLIVEKDVQIPMRDGTLLYADIFRPETTDKVPVIGDFIKGEITDAMVDGYTADKTSDAIDNANEAQGKSISLTQLQALYAMERHDLPSGANWPTENGQPKAPEDLDEAEVQRILAQADTQTGLTSDVTGEIENAWDVYMKKYGDN